MPANFPTKPKTSLERLRWSTGRKLIANLGDGTFGLYGYTTGDAVVVDSWERLLAALPYVHEEYLWRDTVASNPSDLLDDL